MTSYFSPDSLPIPGDIPHTGWNAVNYVLNNETSYYSQGGNNYDVQYAIWFLLYGYYPASTPTAKTIVADALQNGSNFVPSEGQTMAVVVDFDNALTGLPSAQDLIIEVTVPPQPTPPPTIALTKTDAKCNGEANGTLTVTVTGAFTTMTLDGTSKPASSPQTFNVSAGLHTVAVTSPSGPASAQITVGQPATLVSLVSTSETDVHCNGSSTGSFTVLASGGSGGYLYSLDNVSFSSANTFSGLPAGVYTVYAKDENDCSANLSVSIGHPTPLKLGLAKNDASCTVTDGSITATFSGGTPPYQLSLNGVAHAGVTSPFVFTGLGMGPYTIDLLDTENCGVASQSVSLSEICPGGSISGTVYADLNDSGDLDAGDVGLSGITITLAGTDFHGNPVAQTTTTTDKGTYSFAVPVGTYVITEGPTPGYLNNSNTVGTLGGTISGDTIDLIKVTASAAGTGYNFGEVPPASIAGYNYIDANNNGAFDTDETPIVGTTITLTGIDDRSTPVSQTTTTSSTGAYLFSGLRPGVYTVTETQNQTGAYQLLLQGKNTLGTTNGVSDGNLGPSIDQMSGIVLLPGSVGTGFNFGELPPPVITANPIGATVCSVSQPGLFVVASGHGNFTYQWRENGVIITDSIEVTGTLSDTLKFSSAAVADSGSYDVVVTDAYGSVTSTPAVLVVNRTPTPVISVTPVTCSGSGNGKITVQGTDPTDLVSIDFAGSQTLSGPSPLTFTGLAPRKYVVTVTSLAGCTFSQSVDVEEPAPLTVSLVNATDASSSCSLDGSITVSTSGGTKPITYTINHSSWNDTVFPSLAAGRYEIVATDLNGCQSAPLSVTIGPDALVLNLLPVAADCNTKGSLTATFSGGVPAYTLSTNGGVSYFAASSPYKLTGLTSGNYSVILKDSKGCSTSQVATVENTCSLVIKVPSDVTVGCQNSIQACGYTQGGWGATPNGNNPGSLLTSKFATIYPKGCVAIGLTDGTGYSLRFTSAGAITAYLPACGTAGKLTCSSSNPTTTSSGVFGGQVLALQLNVDFSTDGTFGAFVLSDSTSPLNGKTINQILAIANSALGGARISCGMTICDLNTLITSLNEAFDNCTMSTWASTHIVPGANSKWSDPSITGTATATGGHGTIAIAYSDSTSTSASGDTIITRTWTATDGNGSKVSGIQTLTRLSCTLTLGCVSGSGQVNVPYSSGMRADGGKSPYTYLIVSGSLPAGLLLNASSGAITGTPTAAGTSSFTEQVKDANGTIATAVCGIVIAPAPLTIGCVTVTTGQVGAAYSSAFQASGGVAPYTYSIRCGSLPCGLTLDPATGKVTGTPIKAGTWSFTTQVTDSTGGTHQLATGVCCIRISPQPLTLGCLATTTAQVGSCFSSSFVISGGTPSYKFSILSGCLPPGLSLNTCSGAISGTPSCAGVYSFTVSVKDSTCSNPQTATVTCSIAVIATPSGLQANPDCVSIKLTWCPIKSATGSTVTYTVYRANVSGGTYTLLKSGLTTTCFTDSTVTVGATYYYEVSATVGGVVSPNSSPASATVGNLPSPWKTTDVGSVGAAGVASYNNCIFTLGGSGADIWGTVDGFRYVYQPTADTCNSIIAKVTSVQNTSPWAKAGLMIRETTDAGAEHASIFVTPGNGVAFQWRSGTASGSCNVNLTGIQAPCWLKLVRSGNCFSAYYSTDPSCGSSSWRQVGSTQTIWMSTCAKIGLAVTSHSDGTVCTATFSLQSVNP